MSNNIIFKDEDGNILAQVGEKSNFPNIITLKNSMIDKDLFDSIKSLPLEERKDLMNSLACVLEPLLNIANTIVSNLMIALKKEVKRREEKMKNVETKD